MIKKLLQCVWNWVTWFCRSLVSQVGDPTAIFSSLLLCALSHPKWSFSFSLSLLPANKRYLYCIKKMKKKGKSVRECVVLLSWTWWNGRLSLLGIFPNQETLSHLPFPSFTPYLMEGSVNERLHFGKIGYGYSLFLWSFHSFPYLHSFVLMTDAIITGEDAGFVLPAATRSTHAVTVITRPRYFFLSPLFLLQIICLFAFISSGLVLFSQSELVEESLWSPRARSPRC